VLTTRPYYRSSYVFVTRASSHQQTISFADAGLKGRKIGLQRLQEDYSPASLPLIRYGYAAQLVGFRSFGEPAGDIVRAVADGRVGMSVVWGPMAGYFVRRDHLKLKLTPANDTHTPLAYSISAGVHRSDVALKRAIDRSIQRLQPAIERVLQSVDVPQMPLPGGGA
jgi:mxaJ protein